MHFCLADKLLNVEDVAPPGKFYTVEVSLAGSLRTVVYSITESWLSVFQGDSKKGIKLFEFAGRQLRLRDIAQLQR